MAEGREWTQTIERRPRIRYYWRGHRIPWLVWAMFSAPAVTYPERRS